MFLTSGDAHIAASANLRRRPTSFSRGNGEATPVLGRVKKSARLGYRPLLEGCFGVGDDDDEMPTSMGVCALEPKPRSDCPSPYWVSRKTEAGRSWASDTSAAARDGNMALVSEGETIRSPALLYSTSSESWVKPR